MVKLKPASHFKCIIFSYLGVILCITADSLIVENRYNINMPSFLKISNRKHTYALYKITIYKYVICNINIIEIYNIPELYSFIQPTYKLWSLISSFRLPEDLKELTCLFHTKF